jgi:hypothetical protein
VRGLQFIEVLDLLLQQMSDCGTEYMACGMKAGVKQTLLDINCLLNCFPVFEDGRWILEKAEVKHLSIGIHANCRDGESASRAFDHAYVGGLTASLGMEDGLLGHNDMAIVGILEELLTRFVQCIESVNSGHNSLKVVKTCVMLKGEICAGGHCISQRWLFRG